MRIDDRQAWAAVMRRDRTFDGQFVTGVLTTGIYCRPSCAARHPARKNVRLFVDGAAARAAGLRACKRCLPDDVSRDEAAVRAAIDAIRSGESATLAELGAITGYSPTHFSRVFKRAIGLSPAAFARALKEERARDALSGAQRVTDAIYDAGYEAPSRFYAAMEGKMGMSASAWKNGGQGVTIRWAAVDTTLGTMLVAATEKGVCRLSFDEGEADLRARFPKAQLMQGDAGFAQLLTRVIDAVEQPGRAGLGAADIPLDVAGTAFQEACWRALREIPPGETRSYSELAAAAGNPKAVRAAGSANGANNVAVLIPCHRVIRSDGSTGGYAYGTAIKEELLRREQS
ncbi:MAG: methylated-DNA--[protein]-cysteine S-methyltransferase [Erythrobacter sp.]|nr:methylated-DNA--[protein]-cysteine S-methyltransferase [Erythrobacter sp.]NCQ63739.1 methylated-DNA--[protein]-cysteine S-methyltransferase [Alphaproteobacteria bacterium]